MKIKFLFNKTVFSILRFIFDNPTGEFYEKKVAENAKISVGACNKYMRKLAENGFLHRDKRGRMVFYKLNRENPIVKQLKITFTWSSGLVDDIKNRVKEKTDSEEIEISMYGSYARGEDVKDSDLDILLISRREKHAGIMSKLMKIGDEYEKNVKVSCFTRKEWIKMKEDDPAFYERVEKDKIRLV